MAVVDRIFAFTVMGLIVLFALIHLGVSVGIIVPYRKYGDILRPQIGLSAFNLVICLFGLITGILGIFAVRLKSEQFGKILIGLLCFFNDSVSSNHRMNRSCIVILIVRPHMMNHREIFPICIRKLILPFSLKPFVL